MELCPSPLSPADWDAALAPQGLPLQQSATYGAIAAAAGRRVTRVDLREAGRTVAAAQLLRRGPLVLLSRGPVWLGAPDPVRQAVALRALGSAFPLLVATPETAGAPGLPLVTPRSVAEIDLTRPLPVLRAALQGKWRNRLVAAEAAGLTVARGGPPDLDHLVAAESAQRAGRGYRALPPAFTRAWTALDPGGIRVWTAGRGGQTLAAMAFLLHGRTASYHLGWSGPQGRAAGAHNLILWAAIGALAAEGFTLLDLGDVNTDDAPGLARFKIGAGARVRALGPTVLLSPFNRPRRGRER